METQLDDWRSEVKTRRLEDRGRVDGRVRAVERVTDREAADVREARPKRNPPHLQAP